MRRRLSRVRFRVDRSLARPPALAHARSIRNRKRSGANFGPLHSSPDRVWSTDLTDPRQRFYAEGCNVTEADETLVCPATPAGPAGIDITWTVIVDAQGSKSPTTSVAAPVIASLEASHSPLRTAGGDNITVRGRNFGLRNDRVGDATCGGGEAALVVARCDLVEPDGWRVDGLGGVLRYSVVLKRRVGVPRVSCSKDIFLGRNSYGES